ncbi:MAG: phosphate signaling complex protein PhoU [Bacteroidetes bacterium]|nr:phosphate signaling complex protein PhoU [Bacteroidota bacterium]
MKSQFTEQLDRLEKLVIQMGSLVETQVQETIEALINGDQSLAHKVIGDDKKIDDLEIQIDDEVLSLLALHQPVAFDLRDILGISKINGDLERIGDHALNIAESALAITKKDSQLSMSNIPKMCEVVRAMLKDSIDSFIHKNAELALSVCRRDDEIDDLNKHLFADILATMIKKPQTIPTAMEIIRISKNIERIADLCTNICEDVVFISDAKSIKHSKEQLNQ